VGRKPVAREYREQRHEHNRHRQAIPYQTRVVRRPMIIGRAERGEEHAGDTSRDAKSRERIRPQAPTKANGRLEITFQKLGMPKSVR